MAFYGTWENFRLVCGNHEEEVVMQIHEGPHSLFYSCPHYIAKKGERACNNRLPLVDYEYMINHLSEIMHDEAGGELPIVGYSFKRKGVEYTVISQENGVITVRMLNKKAMAK